MVQSTFLDLPVVRKWFNAFSCSFLSPTLQTTWNSHETCRCNSTGLGRQLCCWAVRLYFSLLVSWDCFILTLSSFPSFISPSGVLGIGYRLLRGFWMPFTLSDKALALVGFQLYSWWPGKDFPSACVWGNPIWGANLAPCDWRDAKVLFSLPAPGVNLALG